MATALGIYIDNDLIKYSKVSSNRDKLKIESYGVKYTTDIVGGINQIIEETNSQKLPIVVNAVDEDYHYFDIFAKLNEKDFEKSINLQFEEVTSESTVNKNLLQTGYFISPSQKSSEKLHVLHVSQYITAMETRANLFKTNKPVAQMPIAVSISNLVNNITPSLILNLENETELTGIIDKKVYEVKTLRSGISNIISQINHIENSISKSHEVLKNTVVPISESDNLNMAENEYIPAILVELNQLVDEVKEFLQSTSTNYRKIYVTGTGATISNLELLLSESLPGIEVEILKPFFLSTSSLNVPLKEYIDVNSATALALEELGFSRPTLSFKTGSTSRASSLNFNMDIKDINFGDMAENIKEGFRSDISTFENFSIRLALTSLIVLILFSAVSIMLVKSNKEKLKETDAILAQSRESVTKISQDIQNVKTKTEEYVVLLNKMEEGKSTTPSTTSFIRKDALPNFLNQIAHLIPVRAKVTDIKEDKSHITMTLESTKYEQLGYFVGLLENEKVLTKIKTNTSQKEGNVVKLIVEGDLP